MLLCTGMSSVYILCNVDLLCKVWVGWLTICVCVFRQFVYYVIHQSREKLQGNKSTMTIISNFVPKSWGILNSTPPCGASRGSVRLLLEIFVRTYYQKMLKSLWTFWMSFGGFFWQFFGVNFWHYCWWYFLRLYFGIIFRHYIFMLSFDVIF